MIEIKNWKTGEIIHSGEFDSIKECLEDGVKKEISFAYANLENANLYNANLERANLAFANLENADLDFSSLPLWCGGQSAKIDSKLAKQF